MKTILGLRRLGVQAALNAVFAVLNFLGTSEPVLAQGEVGTVNDNSLLYYAVENLETEEVVRRGTTTAAGFSGNSIILAPETRYRIWLFRAGDGHVGYQEVKTGQAGQRFSIPQITLGFPFSSDSDGDGLSDDAEFVLGTAADNPDSDGDGIQDGAALRLGVDPGLLSRTRIIGSGLTDGNAVDVCAINDIAVVADSTAGVTVFNVFNRMAPIRIAQVNTPGNARAVSCAGNLVAVADGDAGMAIIDIADPPAARVVRQIGAAELRGGNARCVTTLSDLAFVGTDGGWLSKVEMSSGFVLEQINLGGPVEDVASEGDTLYVFAAGRLSVLPALEGNLRVMGSVSAAGSPPSPRGRIFVGGGIAYLTFANGYVAFDVRNSVSPISIQDNRGIFFSWRQVVLDGSRFLLSPVGAGVAVPGLNRYSITNPASPAQFELTIEAPGNPGSVALYNGLAYMASGTNGLHVINYKEVDTGRQPPVGQLLVSVTNGVVTEGQRIVIRADVRDDVQLRNVQFFVNGSPYLVDGNFPFEAGWRAPAGSRGTTITLTAKALDTGGNETNLNPVVLNVLPDTVPPSITVGSPTNAMEYVLGDDIRIDVGFFDANGVDPNTVEVWLDGVKASNALRVAGSQWLIRANTTLGSHTLSIRARDYAGNLGLSDSISIVVLNEGISRELTVIAMERAVGSLEVVSRELTILAVDRASGSREAVSRELTVTPIERAQGALESFSRELTLTNRVVAPSGGQR